jgi:hypothetical protein
MPSTGWPPLAQDAPHHAERLERQRQRVLARHRRRHPQRPAAAHVRVLGDHGEIGGAEAGQREAPGLVGGGLLGATRHRRAAAELGVAARAVAEDLAPGEHGGAGHRRAVAAQHRPGDHPAPRHGDRADVDDLGRLDRHLDRTRVEAGAAHAQLHLARRQPFERECAVRADHRLRHRADADRERARRRAAVEHDLAGHATLGLQHDAHVACAGRGLDAVAKATGPARRGLAAGRAHAVHARRQAGQREAPAGVGELLRGSHAAAIATCPAVGRGDQGHRRTTARPTPAHPRAARRRRRRPRPR